MSTYHSVADLVAISPGKMKNIGGRNIYCPINVNFYKLSEFSVPESIIYIIHFEIRFLQTSMTHKRRQILQTLLSYPSAFNF